MATTWTTISQRSAKANENPRIEFPFIQRKDKPEVTSATDIITTGKRHGLNVGEQLVVTSVTGTKNRRRVQKRDGSTLTVREWRWWDHVVPAWLYRAVSHLPKFPGTERR